MKKKNKFSSLFLRRIMWVSYLDCYQTLRNEDHMELMTYIFGCRINSKHHSRIDWHAWGIETKDWKPSQMMSEHCDHKMPGGGVFSTVYFEQLMRSKFEPRAENLQQQMASLHHVPPITWKHTHNRYLGQRYKIEHVPNSLMGSIFYTWYHCGTVDMHEVKFLVGDFYNPSSGIFHMNESSFHSFEIHTGLFLSAHGGWLTQIFFNFHFWKFHWLQGKLCLEIRLFHCWDF